ncbi:MAG: galactose-1-phosphate uridylyltransferase [Bifidobacteriaceae bacterium]|jgi:UDPglucose--hexose-1-phosphate uridylyltransferase|nr:galactose-1-phosphate uridylyltransferase [Bifidobacteriaceae bacterium]
MTIRITPTLLADGREFFYFDDSTSGSGAPGTPPGEGPEAGLDSGATPSGTAAPGAGDRTASGNSPADNRLAHRLDDPRPLADRAAPFEDPETGRATQPTGPEMRFDMLTGEWIPMASHRMNRTFQPTAATCPLCPAKPGSNYQDGEIPDTDYDVVVFENRFPSYWRAPGQAIHAVHQDDDRGLWRSRPAAGRCEVICFSPDHSAAFATLDPNRVRTIIEAWAVRTEALQAIDGIAQVYPFENRGAEIGVTLPHPHGQIYGYPNVTPKTAVMLSQAAAYARQTGCHLLADLVAAEAAGPRLIAESEHWLAYVPYAARWPVEMHLAPRQDRLDLPALSGPERDDLAHFYPRLLRALDRFFTTDDGVPVPLPYISGWHQAPVDPSLRPLGRLHLELFSIRRAPGKLKYLAGSESGMGAWISDTTPERIADRLRAALAEADCADAAATSPSPAAGPGPAAPPAERNPS